MLITNVGNREKEKGFFKQKVKVCGIVIGMKDLGKVALQL